MENNNKPDSYVKLEINEFADMTIEEFDALYSNGVQVKEKL